MLSQELAQYVLALLALPAFAWYLRQAERLAHLAGSRLRQFRSWLRRSGRSLLRWLLTTEGDEEGGCSTAAPQTRP
ncbi:hypothetical protein OG936_37715 [Streptomyces sp. NBC_00846]|uniref:hypothetical protein n=1 Tax=Streptomyces sp. NBC_00846 TaxID=2975849 RepID=UPI00386484B8|nr:hypothetical protein OG936_37715 [Streptomyces sp. NBC_00846]